MLEEYYQIIYGAVAIVGVGLAIVAGWKSKPEDEPFDWSKVIDSIRSGGIIAPVLAASVLTNSGNPVQVMLNCVTAFTLGMGFNPAVNAVSKTAKARQEIKQAKKLEEIKVNEQEKV